MTLREQTINLTYDQFAQLVEQAADEADADLKSFIGAKWANQYKALVVSDKGEGALIRARLEAALRGAADEVEASRKTIEQVKYAMIQRYGINQRTGELEAQHGGELCSWIALARVIYPHYFARALINNDDAMERVANEQYRGKLNRTLQVIRERCEADPQADLGGFMLAQDVLDLLDLLDITEGRDSRCKAPSEAEDEITRRQLLCD